jgi:hypothetical protein
MSILRQSFFNTDGADWYQRVKNIMRQHCIKPERRPHGQVLGIRNQSQRAVRGSHFAEDLGLFSTYPTWRRLRDPVQAVQPLISSHYDAVFGHRRPGSVRAADE